MPAAEGEAEGELFGTGFQRAFTAVASGSGKRRSAASDHAARAVTSAAAPPPTFEQCSAALGFFGMNSRASCDCKIALRARG
eukprot:2830766-Prymnesium_polylepis.1